MSAAPAVLASPAGAATPALVTATTSTPGSSLTVSHNGRILLQLDLERPVGTSLMGWLSRHPNGQLLEQIARMVGLDADMGSIPEHRKHLDQPYMLVGYGLGRSETRRLGEHVFETTVTMRLTAGKITGPNSCTYVDTDRRELEVVTVCDWTASLGGGA